MQHGRPRAQGHADIAWPAGLTAGEDNCAVALEVIVAKVNGGGSLESE
jgi:hypothetical protein